VDRALEIFISHNVDLAIATLPEGKDPCDLLVEQGAEPFREALANAVDALDFKLNQLLTPGNEGIEGRRNAVEAVLGVIALAPEMAGEAGELKRQLVVNRIAQRLGLQEKTVWARLNELRSAQRRLAEAKQPNRENREEVRQAPAPALERELLEVLLAQPGLVAMAATEVRPDELTHPGLRQLLESLYDLQRGGETPELDQLRARIDNPRLADKAWELQERGRLHASPNLWLQDLLTEFRRRRAQPAKLELQNQLHAANDHTEAVELLRRLQEQTVNVSAAPLAGGARP
jgi:DNA primase